MTHIGECTACQRAPRPLLRFNLIVQDRVHSRTLCQLLCEVCAHADLRRLVGRSVQTTPQPELDVLPDYRTDDLPDDWQQPGLDL